MFTIPERGANDPEDSKPACPECNTTLTRGLARGLWICPNEKWHGKEMCYNCGEWVDEEEIEVCLWDSKYKSCKKCNNEYKELGSYDA